MNRKAGSHSSLQYNSGGSLCHHHYQYVPNVYYSYDARHKPLSALFSIMVIAIICVTIFVCYRRSLTGNVSSSSERTKLETGNAYINDCIEDELNWFDNETKTETKLKSFWEATGVQPYIILKAYDPVLSTDRERAMGKGLLQ